MNPVLIQRMRALLILRYYIEIYKLLLLVYQTAEKRNRPVQDIVKYSPFNQRISKSVNGNTEYFTYEEPEMEADAVADYDNSLNLKVKYVMHPKGIDNPIIQKQNNETYYYNKDGRSSVTSILDEDATVKNTYKYYAFGSSKSKTETIENRYQYTSREKEKENDTYYYRSRMYNPFVGIFIQKDKYFAEMLLKINQADINIRKYRININDSNIKNILHLYSYKILELSHDYLYTGNNPIHRIDSLGKSWTQISSYWIIAIANICGCMYEYPCEGSGEIATEHKTGVWSYGGDGNIEIPDYTESDWCNCVAPSGYPSDQCPLCPIA